TFLILSISCRRGEVRETAAESIIPVKTAAIAVSKTSIPVRAGGILATADEVKLSFKTGGIISALHVEEGQRVKKGDLLASLDLTEINASAGIAREGLEKAERDYERAENLYRDSVGTLERKQNAYTALSAARLNYEIAMFNRSRSVITAPESGVILRKLVGSGEMVAPGYPVFLFGVTGPVWKVRAGIAERDIVRIRKGDSVSVTFDAWPGTSFPGSIEITGEIANPLTGTFEVEILLDRTSYRLASGFIASVEIFPSEGDAYSLIPVESLVEADGNTGFVFYLNSVGEVERAEVGIVALAGASVAVTGLPPGVNEVISGGASYIREGAKVKIVK
nr:efflux RND transporter periplasmic adaptor subunit [Bacteroidales bacterium]